MFEHGLRCAESVRDAVSNRRSFQVIPGDKNSAILIKLTANRTNALRVPQIVLRERFRMTPHLSCYGWPRDSQNLADFLSHLIGDLPFVHLHHLAIHCAADEAGH